MGQHRAATTVTAPPAPDSEPAAAGDLRLKPTHRPLWRGAATVQLGLDPAHAVVVDQLTASTARLLHDLDRGCGPQPTDGPALQVLAAADVLDRPAPTGAAQGRLAPERALLGLLHPGPGATAARLAARSASRVLVAGGGRTGAVIAHLLAASGVGRVTVEDATVVRAEDACPGGVSVADVGLRRGAAATALAVRVAAPVLDAGPPDIALLCPDGAAPPDPAVWWPLLERGTALLCTSIRATTVVVGPFTLPYGTCCPGCVSLHRADRDPAWPLVERQLADPDRAPASTAAATAALAAAAAAAEQVLSWLDSRGSREGRPPPAAVGATLERTLPGWRWRRRLWGAHPGCRCADLQPPAEVAGS